MPEQVAEFSRAKLDVVRKAIAERQKDYDQFKEEMRRLREQIHTLREQEETLERVLAKFPSEEARPVPVALPVNEAEEESAWDTSERLKGAK